VVTIYFYNIHKNVKIRKTGPKFKLSLKRTIKEIITSKFLKYTNIYSTNLK